MHRKVIERHRAHWGERQFMLSSMLSIILFALSYFVVFPYSIEFANTHAGQGVPDIILSNIPVYNVDGFFVYGLFLLVAFITALCLVEPKRIPFTLNALSLFVLIRSVFVTLTHIGPPAVQAVSDFGPAITKAFFGNDFFFSGHTGAPFLMALVFWDNVVLRYVFLSWSVFFGVIVLLGHLHYSIDVASAFFISFGVYHLAVRLFPKDFEYLHSVR